MKELPKSRRGQILEEFQAGRAFKSRETLDAYPCEKCGGKAFPMQISSLKKEHMPAEIPKEAQDMWVKTKYCFTCLS